MIKINILLIINYFVIIINGIQSMDEKIDITKTKEIYVLEDPIWLRKAETSKGLGHDRQPLGIILAAGSFLQVRRINGSTALTLRLIRYDTRLEQEIAFGSSWVNISNSVTSVPFIDTPYVADNIEIEYSYPEDSKPLPVYEKYDDEVSFFTFWDFTNAEFALISSFYFNMLVPAVDKTSLKTLNTTSNINGLIEAYEKSFTFFNKLNGISFDPNLLEDKNIPNKYFFRTDQACGALTVYTDTHAAACGNSLAGSFLNVADTNHDRLRTIAYGYRADFVYDVTAPIFYVWSHIYVVSFQDFYMGQNVFTDGWLYSDVNSIAANIQAYVSNGISINNWNLYSQILFFMLVKDSASETAFSSFNQKYRQLSVLPTFYPAEHPILDLISENFIENGAVDVTLAVTGMGGFISQRQLVKNSANRVPVAYPLFLLVDPALLNTIQAQLNLKTSISLVTPSQLAPTKINGNATITFIIDNFIQIFGEIVTLMDGERYAYQAKIITSTLQLVDIPIGAYSLLLPTGKSSKYAVNNNYLVIKQGSNHLDIQYQIKENTHLISEYFNFLGIADFKFATVDIDLANQIVSVNVTEKTPHDYFIDVEYAHVIIKKFGGDIVYNRTIPGTNAIVSLDQIPFQYGDDIEIYHAEPHRLRIQGVAETFEFTDNINTFKITQLGLESNLINSFENLNLTIQQTSNHIRAHPQWIDQKYMSLKDDVYLAIHNFAPSDEEQLLQTYADVLPIDNNMPGIYVSNEFTLIFEGYSNRVFFVVTIDLINQQIVFEINDGVPHYFFNDTYVSIRYFDDYGVVKLDRNFIGNVNYGLETFSIPFSQNGGEQLSIYHREGHTRNFLINIMQNLTIPASFYYNVYNFVGNGLELVHGSDSG